MVLSFFCCFSPCYAAVSLVCLCTRGACFVSLPPCRQRGSPGLGIYVAYCQAAGGIVLFLVSVLYTVVRQQSYRCDIRMVEEEFRARFVEAAALVMGSTRPLIGVGIAT